MVAVLMESISIHVTVQTLGLREGIVRSTLMNVRSTGILVKTMLHVLILSINTNASVILVTMEPIVKQIYPSVLMALVKTEDHVMKNLSWIIIIWWTTCRMK